MTKTILTAIILLCMTVTSNAQTNKISIIITKESLVDTTLNFDKMIKDFIGEHLKKISSTLVLDVSKDIDKKTKDEIEKISGDFGDTTLTNDLKTKGVDKLILIYYSTDPFEKEMTANGVKKVSYGCRTNLYVQVVNTKDNQILGSKHYYGSAGTAIMENDNYRTKVDAVKASLKNSSPDFTDDSKSLDDFLSKVITK